MASGRVHLELIAADSRLAAAVLLIEPQREESVAGAEHDPDAAIDGHHALAEHGRCAAAGQRFGLPATALVSILALLPPARGGAAAERVDAQLPREPA